MRKFSVTTDTVLDPYWNNFGYFDGLNANGPNLLSLPSDSGQGHSPDSVCMDVPRPSLCYEVTVRSTIAMLV